MIGFRASLRIWLSVLGGLSIGLSVAHAGEDPADHFAELVKLDWQPALVDDGTEDWRTNWTLDGEFARITHSEQGMDFRAGPDRDDHAHHAVMWTKQSFDGPVRFDYTYTKTDDQIINVTILYIQATGSGDGEFVKDISQWAELRTEPYMRLYFNHMNTYHISYAAFGTQNEDPFDDYVRARRYLPLAGEGLQGTALTPDYADTNLFKKGVPHDITVIRHGRDLFMRVRNSEQERLFHWHNGDLPDITEGRIGLRHMRTRSARYRNMQISTLPR